MQEQGCTFAPIVVGKWRNVWSRVQSMLLRVEVIIGITHLYFTVNKIVNNRKLKANNNDIKAINRL